MTGWVYSPPFDALEILHNDHDLIVVNKPAGLLSVPGKAPEHQDCLEHRLRKEFPESLLVHRLDMDTSGIILFARNKHAQRHLGLQFEKRYITKVYHALIWGKPKETNGEIDLPLLVDWPNRPKQKVDITNGKASFTSWSVIRYLNQCTRVCLRPKTGRSHQLRVHMQALGHPILGDRFYAHPKAIKAFDRLALHSHSVSLRHPTGGEEITFTSGTPF